jgi:cell division protein FtsN
MAHDFAKSRTRRSPEPRKKEAPPSPPKGMLITGLITGLAIGFCSSFVLYFSGALPPLNAEPNNQADIDQADLEASQQRRNEELEQAAARLQLEFYKELPNYEVIVDNMPQTQATSAQAARPSATIQNTTTSTTATPAPIVDAGISAQSNPAQVAQGSYMLQAGAFQQEGAAVAQSMRLQALGFPARVKKEALLGKTLFLVQTGPYNSREQITQAERLMRSNSIDSMRIGISQ